VRDDFLWPLVVLSDSDRYTPFGRAAGLVGSTQDTELMMAGAVLTCRSSCLPRDAAAPNVMMGGATE
jgi:hypothetical protein